mmetsp:Transcript_51654/g.96882  ORF Transcript_51654/g.96882 Transcript_51654/m.96882 type:complete len:92 (-) Transcript_51654:54-329(-)
MDAQCIALLSKHMPRAHAPERSVCICTVHPLRDGSASCSVLQDCAAAREFPENTLKSSKIGHQGYKKKQEKKNQTKTRDDDDHASLDMPLC